MPAVNAHGFEARTKVILIAMEPTMELKWIKLSHAHTYIYTYIYVNIYIYIQVSKYIYIYLWTNHSIKLYKFIDLCLPLSCCFLKISCIRRNEAHHPSHPVFQIKFAIIGVWHRTCATVLSINNFVIHPGVCTCFSLVRELKGRSSVKTCPCGDTREKHKVNNSKYETAAHAKHSFSHVCTKEFGKPKISLLKASSFDAAQWRSQFLLSAHLASTKEVLIVEWNIATFM